MTEEKKDIKALYRDIEYLCVRDVKERRKLVSLVVYLHERCRKHFTYYIIHKMDRNTKLYKNPSGENLDSWRPVINILFDAGIDLEKDLKFYKNDIPSYFLPLFRAWRKLWEIIPPTDFSVENLTETDIEEEKELMRLNCDHASNEVGKQMLAYSVSLTYSRENMIEIISGLNESQKKFLMRRFMYHMTEFFGAEENHQIFHRVLELFLSAGLEVDYLFRIKPENIDKKTYHEKIKPLLKFWTNYWRRTNVGRNPHLLEDLDKIAQEYY